MSAYGLWPVVLINSLVFIVFAFSFVRPRTSRDWRSLGAFSGFILALFTEMYGFPLTIYLLSGWLGNRYPGVDFLAHDNGHIWYTVFGFQGDPHTSPIHLLSNILIIMGMFIIFRAWPVLRRAQKEQQLATTGVYAHVRHPQYVAFIIIMLGFLIQWPTLVTVLMFPVLLWIYARLARHEEREAVAMFGTRYENYAKVTPAFFPRLFKTKMQPVGNHKGNSLE